MTPAAKKLKQPNKTAPFKEYILYYMKRKGWSQSTLAQYARLSQSNVCKIINGNYERTKMESFVSLFLVLQLTVKESKDLLSRAERAFSPSSELHTVYKDLIWYYSTVHDDTDILTMLDYADKYLMDRGYDPLPNSFISKGRE